MSKLQTRGLSGQSTYKSMLKSISYQRNAKQSEVLFHIQKRRCYYLMYVTVARISKKRTAKDVGKLEFLYSVCRSEHKLVKPLQLIECMYTGYIDKRFI